MFNVIVSCIIFLVVYVIVGIIVCAAIKCTTDIFDGYDAPFIPVIVFGWPVALVALVVMGLLTIAAGGLEKAVNFVAEICTNIKTKLQDRMKED